MAIKICRKCKQPKDLETAFSRDRYQKDGHQNRCKACNRDYQQTHKPQIAHYKRSYSKRPAQVAYRRAYEQAHPRLRADRRARHFQNREENLARMRDWYRRNKASVAARRKAYYQKYKKRISNYNKLRYYRLKKAAKTFPGKRPGLRNI
jgi:hypothetical protein